MAERPESTELTSDRARLRLIVSRASAAPDSGGRPGLRSVTNVPAEFLTASR